MDKLEDAMPKLKLLMSTIAVVAAASPVLAGEAQSCRQVRLAEPGWNDLAFTTGVGLTVLKALGYEPESKLLGIDVIYTSLRSGDLDVFLGYWDPAMVSYYQPYKDDGSVETVRVKLKGAKYTFAVPDYVWEAGVRDFSDLKTLPTSSRRRCTASSPAPTS
jgi:glycine betaine/proline transport system substrate-binding protein